ncbi:MAG: hypothetical protein WCG75_06425 [Armatimonadota bacterium]
MYPFAEPLNDLKHRIKNENYSLTDEDHTLLHNAYWDGHEDSISVALTIICRKPDPAEMHILLDACSPGSDWIERCDAAQAFSGLGEEGRKMLHIMLGREKHFKVRFYVQRELIDIRDESMNPLLDGPIPPNSSPGQRSLWVYGNYERGDLSADEALAKISKLLEDPKRRHEWLRDHVSA